MLTKNQAETMLILQAGMNAKVNPDWINAAYPYLRAVVVEGAEAMEHRGWKWWKKQHCDLEQLQMELLAQHERDQAQVAELQRLLEEERARHHQQINRRRR